MEYTIKIFELLKRPIIRHDMPLEWMNKMSDAEMKQWDEEAYQMLREEGVEEKYPDFNSAHLAKQIDRHVLYTMYTLATKNGEKQVVWE